MKAVVGLQLCVVVVIIIAAAGCTATRSSYESAPYKIVRTDGKFQVRDYPALTVAQTAIDGSDSGADAGFHRLHNFVVGENAAGEKLTIATPVFLTGGERRPTLALFLPAKASTNGIPSPSNGEVMVGKLPAGRFAVLRFSGGRNGKNKQEAVEQLRGWATERGLAVSSAPVYAYFDPPWVPGFVRRNEVMLRTEPSRREFQPSVAAAD